MDEQPVISVLVPALNEESRIYQTVTSILQDNRIHEVIVIDDGSMDNTSAEAERAGAKVVRTPKNLGKGGALNLGLQNIQGDIILMLDADLGASAKEGCKLLDPILQNKADLTIGRFPPAKKKGGFGFVIGLARKGVRAMTGLDLQAPLSGQRAMRRAVMDALGRFESGFGVEVGMIIDLARKGYIIREVPVQMTHAETGRDIAGFLHRGRQFIDVLRVLLKHSLPR
ncbi:MAG TPA: glycosyltransferase family 2 protein [Bacillota bacterium]|nr:glycosyltransferase family 2 protein [Bacillota bacterium]